MSGRDISKHDPHIGLYGTNGHQLPERAAGPARTIAYETLDDVLAAPGVDLVSLCSPRRADQAADAVSAAAP